MTEPDRDAACLLDELLGDGDAVMTVTRAAGLYTVSLIGSDSTFGSLCKGVGRSLEEATSNLSDDVRRYKMDRKKTTVAQDAVFLDRRQSFPIARSSISRRAK